MDQSFQVNQFNYTPPSFLQQAQPAVDEKPCYNAKKYPESSSNVMCHQEVLDYFGKKRTTILSWRKNRNFPDPISKSPLRWLRKAVMEWVEHEGGFKAS
jgi:predicted DNA-binding transcriptional regulator AlpA